MKKSGCVKHIDLTGQSNGYITVIKFSELRRDRLNKVKKYWECVCTCGKIIYLSTYQFNSKKPRSCGCYKQARKGNVKYHDYHITHGLSRGYKRHPIYGLWKNIKQRCYNKNNPDFKTYMAKGIKMCDEWLQDAGAFYSWCLENGWKRGLVIDRIDSAKNYSPDNCQFITMSENSKKVFKENPTFNRGSNHRDAILTEEKVKLIRNRAKLGERSCDLAKEFGIKQNVVYQIRNYKTWKHVA